MKLLVVRINVKLSCKLVLRLSLLLLKPSSLHPADTGVCSALNYTWKVAILLLPCDTKLGMLLFLKAYDVKEKRSDIFLPGKIMNEKWLVS